ncbi:MAG TPA: ABC transporter ATP-binding protein [Casimicrobiaceae bacterium]|nr:ABC transporter ATP-binding protein [Casimicrobiaceae bacterium]
MIDARANGDIAQPSSAGGAPPLLELRDVSISYFGRHGEIPSVTSVSLTLNEGEALGLVGESGCGKSTIAYAILAYLSGKGRVVGGSIRFRGRDLASLSATERVRGSGIGIIYQEAMSALNPTMTVGDQLAEVAVFHRAASWDAARIEAAAALRDVRLADIERVRAAYPHQLSGGQQQRVVIAMALLGRPALLLLDEPTTSLDVTVEAGIVELIASLRAKYRTALLFISHNLGLVAQVCDRVAVMYSGEIVEEGPVDDVFVNPRHPYTRGLINCIPLPYVDQRAQRLVAIPGQVSLPHERPAGCYFGPRCRHFVMADCERERIPLLTIDGTNRSVRCVRWQAVTEAREPMQARDASMGDAIAALEVRDLSKDYGVDERSLWSMLSGRAKRQVRANRQLSFDVNRGQTLAIVGESGCGKSTFAKVLMGLERASAGEIRMGDVDLARLPVDRRRPELKSALQMVFQNPDETLNPSYSVGAQIGRAVRKLGAARGRSQVAARVSELLELTRLSTAFASRLPRQLSGGQKQRVGIARAFAGRPSLVVADEPVSALDVSVRAAITELLIDVQRKHGTTLVLISHDLGLVRYIADRVVVMYLGRAMEVGTVEQIFAPPYHPYTEALLSAIPVADSRVVRRKVVLSGELPSPLDPPKGCPFHTRCPRKVGRICEDTVPAEQALPNGHRIACHIPADELAGIEPVMG